MPYCQDAYPEGLWKDIYGDPVRPRRNGYAWPPDFLQLASWAFIIIISLIYFLAVVPFIEDLLFIVALIISLFLTVSVVILKVSLELLSQEDPEVFAEGSPRLEQEDLTEEAAPEGKEPCIFCRRFVQKGCKHCSVCDKCVPGFDHHCRWLNTCVGEKNYSIFAIFMSLAWVGMVWIAVFCIWFAQDALRDIDRFKQRMRNHAFFSNAKAFPAIMVFVFICLILSLVGTCLLGKLISFHIYLRYTQQTTYDYLLKRREKKKKKGTYVSSAMKPPKKGLCNCTGLQRRRNFKKNLATFGENEPRNSPINERNLEVQNHNNTNGSPPSLELRPDERGMISDSFVNHGSRTNLLHRPLHEKKNVPQLQEECPDYAQHFLREPIG